MDTMSTSSRGHCARSNARDVVAVATNREAGSAKSVHRGERQTLEEMGEIFVEPEQLVPARHVLARRIDENDDRRAAACFHRGQDVTGQQDRAVNPERRTFDDAVDHHLALAVDLGGAVQRP